MHPLVSVLLEGSFSLKSSSPRKRLNAADIDEARAGKTSGRAVLELSDSVKQLEFSVRSRRAKRSSEELLVHSRPGIQQSAKHIHAIASVCPRSTICSTSPKVKVDLVDGDRG